MRTTTHLTKNSTTGRAAAAVAVAALAGLVTVAPAHARTDPGPSSGGLSPADVRVWENENSSTGGSGFNPGPSSLVTPIDDNAVEVLQIALGAVGGLAVAGAFAMAAGRRHGDAHPA